MSEEFQNISSGYDPVAKMLHWLIVLLLVAQYAIAWTMPEIEHNTTNEGLVSLHLSVGAVILLVMAIRVAWHLTHRVSEFNGDLPPWWRWSAQFAHRLLYGGLIVMPLLGWANASYRGWSVDLFGIATLPPILPKDDPLGDALGDVHGTVATAVLILVGLHVAAALYHHFLRRDRLLTRILPANWVH